MNIFLVISSHKRLFGGCALELDQDGLSGKNNDFPVQFSSKARSHSRQWAIIVAASASLSSERKAAFSLKGPWAATGVRAPANWTAAQRPIDSPRAPPEKEKYRSGAFFFNLFPSWESGRRRVSEAELNLELLLGRRPKSVALVSGATGALPQPHTTAVVFLCALCILCITRCAATLQVADEMRADTCANVSNPINGREAP